MKGFFEAPGDHLDVEAIDEFFSDEENYRDVVREVDVATNWNNITPVNATPNTTIRANPEHAQRVDWAREGF